MSKRLFYTKLGWDDMDRDQLSRSIKLFSLMNKELVIPSNHIYAKHAKDFFYKHPELLELKLIKPAMDPKYSSFQDYFSQGGRAEKAGTSLVEYGRYLDAMDVEKVSYSDTEPAGIFTELAIEQFSNEQSVLSKAAGLNMPDAHKFLDRVEEVRQGTHNVIYYNDFMALAEAHFKAEQVHIIRKFADLNRIMAGASSVRCNNLIPQENLIDWCLVKPQTPKDFILSDEQIFWEVFFESMIKLTDGIFNLTDLEKVTPKTLDKFSFEEIDAYRKECIIQNDFINKYNSVIENIDGVPKLGDAKIVLLDFDQLINLKASIRSEFSRTLDQEVSLYTELELLESLMKVTYQIFGGAIETVSSVVNFFSIPFNKQKDWNVFLKNQELRIERAYKFASKRISNKAVLIEYMEELMKKSKEVWYK
ncbi:MAG: hypothetical protein AAF990_13905 [Bacteroidota bacterium]